MSNLQRAAIGCFFDPHLQFMVHKFCIAQRTCHCAEVVVPEPSIWNAWKSTAPKPSVEDVSGEVAPAPASQPTAEALE